MRQTIMAMYGGKSCEHDVSIITALQFISAANRDKYNVIPLYVARDGGWYTGNALLDIDIYKRWNSEASGVQRVMPDLSTGELLEYASKSKLFGGRKVVAKVDIAAPLFHGLNGEDGSIQGLLELMNIPYTSAGLLGSAVGMDKIAQKQLFKGCGFPVLDFVWYTAEEFDENRERVLNEIEARLGYALFVKPANLGSSIGIHKAKDRVELAEALEVAFSFDRRVIIEPAVEKPLEVNCSVLGFAKNAKASVLEAPVTWQEFLTFEEKYISNGKTGNGKAGFGKGGGKSGGMADTKRVIPAPIGDEKTEQIKKLSLDIFRTLDCKGVVRIDYIIDEASGTVYVNEINTIPGSLAFYLWSPVGVSFEELIDTMVRSAIDAHSRKNKASYGFDSSILQKVSGGALKGVK